MKIMLLGSNIICILIIISKIVSKIKNRIDKLEEK